VPVVPGDTPESLAARVLAQEHVLYPQALRMICSGEAELRAGRVVFRETWTGTTSLRSPA
jgi:phosphoribosylglycinamide formyltransferase-1